MADETAALRPTLVIGLGGLGREVVFRTRRRLYERYRRTSLPVTGFLWVDRDTERNPTPELPARVARKVALSETARVSLRLHAATAAQMLSHPDLLPGVSEVLPNNASTAGLPAERSRLIGHLAFVHRQAEFLAAVDRQVAQIGSPAAAAAAKALGFAEVEPRIEVVVVASLAGGIGSGSLLGLADAVRGHIPNARVRCIVFLSGLFVGYDERRRLIGRANGYAAFREVHSAQSGPNPPFHGVYVVDRETGTGQRPIDPLEPIEMVAETLVLELSRSAFSGALRRHRYATPQLARYSAFGMAGMAPGGGRLRSAAAYLLGATLLERWAANRGRPEARRCGLGAGWPEAELAAAARDMREEFETYDIPPIEERNFSLQPPTDLPSLLMAHVRGDNTSLTDDALLDGQSERFAEWSERQGNGNLEAKGFEGFMDRLELYCLGACRLFDERIVGSYQVVDPLTTAAAVEHLQTWASPWVALSGAGALRTSAQQIGSGMPPGGSVVQAVQRALPHDPLYAYHPGTVVRYVETEPLEPRAIRALQDCRLAYQEALRDPAIAAHRHACHAVGTLADPLAE